MRFFLNFSVNSFSRIRSLFSLITYLLKFSNGMMVLSPLSKLIFIQIFIGTSLASQRTLVGQTIDELSKGFYLEIQNDYGYPLNEVEAESLWLETKEFHWASMKKRPTELFPFLVCSSQPDSSTYKQQRSITKLLERSASVSGQKVSYFNPYSSSRDVEISNSIGISKVSIEPMITRADSSCFLTSMSYNMAVSASEYPESQYVLFNPLTPSMKMLQGTIDTLSSVLEGSYSDIPNPRLALRTCPHVTAGYTKNVLAKNIVTFLHHRTPASSKSHVTKSSFFHRKMDSQDTAILPDRFKFWHDKLEAGVENTTTDSCKSLLDRVKITKSDEVHWFNIDVDLQNSSESERSCFWSMVAAIGEMSSICQVEINFSIDTEQSHESITIGTIQT